MRWVRHALVFYGLWCFFATVVWLPSFYLAWTLSTLHDAWPTVPAIGMLGCVSILGAVTVIPLFFVTAWRMAVARRLTLPITHN